MSPSPRRLSPLVLLSALACSHGGSDTPITTQQPAIVGSVTLTANDNPWVPQAAIVSVATDVPTRVELRITEAQRTWLEIADPTYTTQHPRVPVIGMRADRSHSIEVLVRDQNGNVTTAPTPLQFTTPPLPADFPPIDVRTSSPQTMEPGVTLLSLLGTPACIPTLIDAEGNVVWYLNCGLTPLGQDQTRAFPLHNGNLMLISAERLMLEVNLLGDVVQMFSAGRLGPIPGTIPVDTDSFHHDIVVMPEGSDADYAVLGTELRVLPDYPNDVVDPTQTEPSANVIGDEIVEFTKTGAVVRRFRLLDLLDPYRVSYDSLGSFWDDHYGGLVTRDWSHANALVLDATTNSWLVSLRHQDAVLKIGRSSHQLEWILGDHDRWNAPWTAQLLDPLGGAGFQFQYHQHAVQLQPDGTLFMFDNGCGRAIPPVPQLSFGESYSRAVQFQVDPVAHTVQQRWSYGGPPNTGVPSFYSFFVSSAYPQPLTGNVLICDGGKAGANGRLYAHVFEITNEATPHTAFECYVQGDANSTASYFIYRAWRLPGLYRGSIAVP